MIHDAYGCIGQRNMHSNAKSIDPFDTTPFRTCNLNVCTSLKTARNVFNKYMVKPHKIFALLAIICLQRVNGRKFDVDITLPISTLNRR